MAESRKVLVAFDPDKPKKSSSDFLVPVCSESGEVEFLGTRSKKIIPYGMLVLTSRNITENDLFAKLVDTGRQVASVDETLALLTNFVEAMKTVKIGNVVVAELNEGTMTLTVLSKSPSGFRK
ncbi:MAG: hypothetical protein DWQ31_19190 [Planctomycetota bacterium]|mgnify:CR=1 FL=1|nr:MAG: hypothetical protein DWQ31_19190 [Planctomycetota bacterium]REJ88037.1 MAG: hypothetical protein DWQ35_20420 [Planctomycetota bacterium]REK27109.1 MAG: hypothetical protein DWQ42_07680 [Planctomycetota bacterium]REK38247.1 MAG: hypothetical protein DWQ46_20770 [Planctomycetota bacterium]